MGVDRFDEHLPNKGIPASPFRQAQTPLLASRNVLRVRFSRMNQKNGLTPMQRILAASFTVLLATGSLASEHVDFATEIRPLLSDNCFQCHGPDADSRKSNLRLDDPAAASVDLGG